MLLIIMHLKVHTSNSSKVIDMLTMEMVTMVASKGDWGDNYQVELIVTVKERH